jgi:hypothetical protein
MKEIIKYLLEKKFNRIDVIGLIIAGYLSGGNHFIATIITIIITVILSIIIEISNKYKGKI